jgi:hypothetical protein
MLPNKDVLDMAKRECKGDATSEEIAWLHDEENRIAWCHALITALSDSDSQMVFHKTRIDMSAKDVELGLLDPNDFDEEKLKFDEWLRKAQRYRNGINKRLSEVKTILSNLDSLEIVEQNARLVRAIIEHKRASFEGEYTAEPHDIRLWSTVIDK